MGHIFFFSVPSCNLNIQCRIAAQAKVESPAPKDSKALRAWSGNSEASNAWEARLLKQQKKEATFVGLLPGNSKLKTTNSW